LTTRTATTSKALDAFARPGIPPNTSTPSTALGALARTGVPPNTTTTSKALGAPRDVLETRNATTSNALGALDHALGETTPPATASKALGPLAVAEQDTLTSFG